MKAQHRGLARRAAASAAVILATLALTTPVPAQAQSVGDGAETGTSVVRPPQAGECHDTDV